MDIKFLTQDNEVQKLYAKFGMVVPVGDLSTGKAPAVQPLSTESTQTSVTAKFNVLSGTDITAMSYTVNDGEAVSVTPTKGVITITLTDLDYNSGPYEIVITAVNENGSTSAKADVALQHYTNWATADEVLEGNKFIGEDGQEAVGTYVAPEPVIGTLSVTANNTYIASDFGYDGFSEVTVNVPSVVEDYSYLRFTAIDSTEISMSIGNYASHRPVLYYSRDNENWGLWEDVTVPISIQAGENLYMYGENHTISEGSGGYAVSFRDNGGRYSISGDITALLTRHKELSSSVSEHAFTDLFKGCTGLTDISSLNISSTRLAMCCYSHMFQDCTGITSLPSGLLPATALSQACYQGMFQGCTGLTSLPSDLLPATTLGDSCYYEMFQGCTGITSLPSDLLPATVLTALSQGCYQGMFQGCTGLTSLPSGLLPATALSQGCYRSMFQDCTSLGSVPEDLLPSTYPAPSCYYSMFQGCTSLGSAPKINFTTNSASSCMSYMFQGCTSLSRIITEITTWSSADNWVQNVAASGDFYNLGGANIPVLANGIPTGWTEHSSLYPVWVRNSSLDELDYDGDWTLTFQLLMDNAPASWNGEAVLTIDGAVQPAIQFDSSFGSVSNRYNLNGIELSYPFSTASVSVTIYDTTTGNVFGTSTSAIHITPVLESAAVYFDDSKIDIYFEPASPRLAGSTNYIMLFAPGNNGNNLASNVALFDNIEKFTLQKTGNLTEDWQVYVVISTVNPLVAYPDVEPTLEAYKAAGWTEEYESATSLSEIIFELNGANVYYDETSSSYKMIPSFSKMPQDYARWELSMDSYCSAAGIDYTGYFSPTDWPTDMSFETTEDIAPCGQPAELNVSGDGNWYDETTGEYRSCSIPPIMVTISVTKPCDEEPGE